MGLVLRRKMGEEIKIGRDIRVKVVGIELNAVKLYVIAPDEINIARAEIDDGRERREGQPCGQ